MTTIGLAWMMLTASIGQAGGGGEDRAGSMPVAFRLQDHRGAWHSVDEAKASKLVVVAFVGTECPLADAYAPKLAKMARDYEGRGVAFFGVDANQQDGPVEIGRFAEAHGVPFPILKDVGNELADRLKAGRTPEVFVLDEGRRVRYRGRIDDQLAIGVHRPAPTRRDLADALDALLAGKPVDHPVTEAEGCIIGRVARPDPASAVTYAGQVSRILQANCVGCHRPGEIAPFSLTDYKQASGWSSMIAEVVDDGRMPPWHSVDRPGTFANDARLSDEDKKALRDWVAAGAPEGNPADLPPPARFDEGWRIPRPDIVIEMPEAVEIPAEGVMPYQHVVIDPQLKQDVWVRGSQVRPGNPSVVHHMIAYVVPPGAKGIDEISGEFLAAYAPGMPPRVFADGVAMRVPAGSKIVFQLHYTPKGTEQSDRSRIGLVLADPPKVRKQLRAAMTLDHQFKIPPGDPHFVSTGAFRFEQASVLYSLMPHMHLRGKSVRFDVTYPDGRSEILLDVPRYEFDWQNLYVLSRPKPMPEGAVVRSRVIFDNSTDNPNNPDPTRTVTFGQQTRDEMHVGYLNFALAEQDLSRPSPIVAPGVVGGKQEVTFRYRPDSPSKTVSLVGTFTNWKDGALPMAGPDAEGTYEVKVPLGPGVHEYKYLLDGDRYRPDPGNIESIGYFRNSAVRLGANP